MVFTSIHVHVWELDLKEGWASKNWCFQTVLNEESSWESLGLQGDPTSPSLMKSVLNIHWKDWCWSWSSNIWPPDAKSQFTGKNPDAGKGWGQDEKWATEDEMVGWHHRFNGHKFEQIQEDSEEQGSLACLGLQSWLQGVMKSWTWLSNRSRCF